MGLSTFHELAAAYAEPARAYHNTRHLQDCLQQFDRNQTLATRANEVEAALWFHDAVYSPGKPDNEVRSARLAEAALMTHGVAIDSAQRVAALVLATRHLDLANDPDAQLVCDVDLSILGREADEYDEFEALIRREYAWVPEPVYRATRAAVLNGFLRRPSIYQSRPFRERYEQQARHNLERTVATLTR
jgi:predicted metal-dependent HD superfamily phosphohydrolase